MSTTEQATLEVIAKKLEEMEADIKTSRKKLADSLSWLQEVEVKIGVYYEQLQTLIPAKPAPAPATSPK